MKMPIWVSLVFLSFLISGCASWVAPTPSLETPTPSTWHAPRPHQGSVDNLLHWWERFDDPVLVEWIALAEKNSPTLAAAKTQVFSARADRMAGTTALFPHIDLFASASRSATDGVTSPRNLLSSGAQATWEPGIWGQSFATLRGLDAQYQAAQAQWHEARVLVAAELAQSYFAYRFSEMQLSLAQFELDSLQQTQALIDLTEQAGFSSTAEAALMRAYKAEMENRVIQQRATRDKLIKSLVVLTALDEPTVRDILKNSEHRHLLARAMAGKTLDDLLNVPAVPANTITQRPDVLAAQQAVIIASAKVGVARAALLPGLSVSGYVSTNHLHHGGTETQFNAWSIGPLSFNLPILNIPALNANKNAAKVGYEQAITAYQTSVRQAIREVEEGLVELDRTAQQVRGALIAVANYQTAFNHLEIKYQSGFASQIELEEARRNQLSAEKQLLYVQSERIAAWITLYRALGGGWDINQMMEVLG